MLFPDGSFRCYDLCPWLSKRWNTFGHCHIVWSCFPLTTNFDILQAPMYRSFKCSDEGAGTLKALQLKIVPERAAATVSTASAAKGGDSLDPSERPYQRRPTQVTFPSLRLRSRSSVVSQYSCSTRSFGSRRMSVDWKIARYFFSSMKPLTY